VISSYGEVWYMGNIIWHDAPYDERGNLARFQVVVIATKRPPRYVLETCTFPLGYPYPLDHPRSSSMILETDLPPCVPFLVDSIYISRWSCSDMGLGDFGLHNQIHDPSNWV